MLKSQFDTAMIYQLPIIVTFKSCLGSSQESWFRVTVCVQCMRKHGPERVQRKNVTLCTIIYLDCDVIYAITVWQLYLQDCEDLGFALWICIIAYAGHRL